jgi:serine/threonine protein kinase/Tol biopolymer transport system component
LALSRGTRLGVYEITAPIGEGGMGQVYRATDTTLSRQVAIKILPDAFASDSDRLARFEREAKTLAALNHPNIAAIYGFENSAGLLALVMELVEGDDLSQRIVKGAIAIDEVLPIAKQIADALEAAHEQGIIHRDLKPANIKVRADGTVKLLDFGLAKAMEPTGAASASASESPTITAAVTQAGVILGTPAYMSPEQARGKLVDERTDIWAFGCILFEMLAGRRCFEHLDSISDGIAAILTRDPDWRALPPDTPEPIRRLLRRCLNKNAAGRLHHLADARLEIDEALASPIASSAIHGSPTREGLVKAVPWMIAAALAVVVVGLGVTLRMREPPSRAQPVAQFEMNLPPGVELYQGSTQVVAFSPAGTHVAFVGSLNGLKQVYVRDLSQLDGIAVRGSENALSCFFSPAGDAVGFITDLGVFKASLRDLLVTSLAPDALNRGGGTWGPDGWVTFARDNGLWQVPAEGGTARQVTTLTAGESLHAWPAVVNDGKTILFTSVPSSGVQRARVETVAVDTGKRQVLIEGARFPRHTSSGHLVFYREGGLHAAPFDANRLSVTGPPMEVTAAVEQDSSGAPLAEISSAGSLVYLRAGVASGRLIWVSRQAIEQPVTDVPRAYLSPRLTADNRRIVVGVGSELWIQDTLRSTFTRLTRQQSETASNPVWTPDGKQVVFRTPTGLRSIETDGSGRSRTIPGTTSGDFPSSVSPDGTTVATARRTTEGLVDIYVVSFAGDTAPRALVTGPHFEGGPQFSPDGRWLAYVSNESGQFQVYLRRYPGPEGRWTVSTGGGTSPLWNHTGTELFYRNGNKMMAVSVATTPDVTLATPRVIFEGPYSYGSTIALTNYDVSADGQRFLMVKNEAGGAHLNVALNWFSELARLAPRGSR